MSYINGEKIQSETNLFITTQYNLNYNPNITINHSKALDINRQDIHIECHLNYNKFNDTIFDGAGHGIKLIGRDRYHENPLSWLFINELDNTIKYKWEKNNNGLLVPYLLDTINNLHIHCKDLDKGFSKPLE